MILYGDRFDCQRCKFNRHCDTRGDWPGSRGPAPAPEMPFIIPGVIESRTCFLPMITAQSREWLRLYGHYKAGQLFTAGGIADQPALYLDAMEIIEGAVNKVNAEKRELEEQKKRRARN